MSVKEKNASRALAKRSSGKTVCVFFAFGCDRARYDTHMLVEYFRKNDWQVLPRPQEADLIVMCLCGFTQGNEHRSLKVLSRQLRRKKKDAQVLVTGCLAGICKTKIAESFDAVPVNLHNSTELDDYIGARAPLLEVLHNRTTFTAPTKEDIRYIDAADSLYSKLSFSAEPVVSVMTRALCRPTCSFPPKAQQNQYSVRVATGCLEDCAYCAIKNASGRLRSRPIETIVREFRAGLANGYTTIKLLGEDVGAYGQDTGASVVDLLQALWNIKGDYRIVWTDFHPKWLIQNINTLSRVLAENSTRLGYMGFPIQSGSNKVLRQMQRDYSVCDAEKAFLELERAAPNAELLTHILIGFPGESAEDFEQTLAFVEEVDFRYIYVYRYSDRPNTESILLPEKVSPTVILRRYWRFIRRFRDRAIV